MKVENSSNVQTSYGRILKATSILGGVQVLTILSGVVRTKAAALLLGPAGIGILGLFSSSFEVIKTGAGLGLSSSSVREISKANASESPSSVGRVIAILKRWLLITATIGSLLMIIISPFLSRQTFGSLDYTSSFILLSLAVFFYTLSGVGLSTLQGLGRLKSLAKIGVWTSVLSIFIVVPLYYFLGNAGIVPSIVVSGFCLFAVSWFHVRTIKSEKISFNLAIKEGFPMVKLGIALTAGSLVNMLAAYLLRVYIGHSGGLDDVGFFQAGMIVAESYLGLIFTSMNSDFYPRLSAVSEDNKKMSQLINEQAEIALLIVGPVIVILLSFLSFVICLLYENHFMVIQPFLIWAMIGNLLKIVSVTTALALVAKGHSKLFIITSIVFQVTFLLASCLGYFLGGIAGLGIAYLVNYAIQMIVIVILCSSLFRLTYHFPFWKIFAITTLMALSILFFKIVSEGGIYYLLCSICILFSLAYSLFELDRRIHLKDLIKKYFE